MKLCNWISFTIKIELEPIGIVSHNDFNLEIQSHDRRALSHTSEKYLVNIVCNSDRPLVSIKMRGGKNSVNQQIFSIFAALDVIMLRGYYIQEINE